MFKLKDFNPHNYPITPDLQKNLEILTIRISRIEMVYGKPLTITSGLRSEEQQQSLISQGKSNATHSKHLLGQAADIGDTSGALYDWCKANEKLLAEIELWMEERQGGWQHFQIVPPKSGKRWFFP